MEPENLQVLIQDFLKSYFSFYPTSATDNGYAGYDDQLPDFNPDKVNDIISIFNEHLNSLSKVKAQNFEDKINADLLKRKIELQIFNLKSNEHHIFNPAFHVGIVSNSLFALMMGTHRTDQEKLHAILSRLNKIPKYLKQAQTIIDEPVELWTQIAIEELPGVSTYLSSTIEPFLKSQTVVGLDQILESTRHAIFEYLNFLTKISKTRKSFAIGLDNFEYLLKTFHGINKSPQEIKTIGFEQIDLLCKQLDEHAAKIDDDKTWQELVDLLKDHHPTEDQLLKAYQHKVDELKTFLIEKKLVTIPREESLKIISTPEFLQSSIPYAAYSPPTMFSKDAQGLLFVSPAKGNLDVLKEHCYAAFPLTALHEGYPGHHLQFSIQRTLNSDIRKVFNVASYYEGWTLYCEEMMYRAGFYDDAMRLYQLKDRLWRAARIVVDVSMQCYGMTDEEAVSFLVDNAKLSEQGARVDVNWYTQSPTIPMSYLIGMLEVDQMRANYIKMNHSLKEFHDKFLSCGAIPLKHVNEILFNEKT